MELNKYINTSYLDLSRILFCFEITYKANWLSLNWKLLLGSEGFSCLQQKAVSRLELTVHPIKGKYHVSSSSPLQTFSSKIKATHYCFSCCPFDILTTRRDHSQSTLSSYSNKNPIRIPKERKDQKTAWNLAPKLCRERENQQNSFWVWEEEAKSSKEEFPYRSWTSKGGKMSKAINSSFHYTKEGRALKKILVSAVILITQQLNQKLVISAL